MKKIIVSFAAVAALAFVPGSALGQDFNAEWGGYDGEHCNNAASADYWTAFGDHGEGNSHYYIDTTDTEGPGDCANMSADEDTGIETTGYAMDPTTGDCITGCDHSTTQNGSIGAFYIEYQGDPIIGMEGFYDIP